jgi:short-subunit dehydrogenase
MARSFLLVGVLSIAIGVFWWNGGASLSPKKLASLKGKRVIVTGGSKGIGRDVAKLYAKAGAHVMICARSLGPLEETSNELKELSSKSRGGGAVYHTQADLSTKEGVDTFFDTSVEALGGVDILILNHVIGYFGEPLKMESAELYDSLTSLFQINAVGVMYLAHRAVPLMEKTNGAIVVVSSLAGKMGLPSVAPYSASKHALHGFFDSYRLELQTQEMSASISTVVLGNIDTESNRKATEGKLPDSVVCYPPAEAAAVIVSAAHSRVREVYYPKAELLSILTIRFFLPSLADWIVRNAIAMK